jgi:CubicO group peptidase (beta-lactamase class C family)
MRRLALKSLVLTLFAAANVAVAPLPSVAQTSAQSVASRAGFDSAKLSAIVDWLKADVEMNRIPGAVVLVARDGKILLHEAVGWQDKDKKIPMRRDSIHPIASSTKLITTVAALRLFEANKLQIMAPIATYLPELKDLKISVERRDAAGNVTTELLTPPRQPTVQDLMTHRAGFTYFFFPPNSLRSRYRELGIDRTDTMSADEMLQKLGTLPLAFSPGYSWNLFNPVRTAEGGPPFPGSVGDVFWGGITGPRYFFDPKEKLVGIVFMLVPAIRAAYHAELRAMVYAALTRPRLPAQ